MRQKKLTKNQSHKHKRHNSMKLSNPCFYKMFKLPECSPEVVLGHPKTPPAKHQPLFGHPNTGGPGLETTHGS